MAEQEYPIETFRYGLDTRRDVLTSLPGTLVTCENCHINQGGEIEGRKAFVDTSSNANVVESITYAITATQGGSANTTVTVTLASHGLNNGDWITISGATETWVNGAWAVSNVTINTFDFIVPVVSSGAIMGTPVLAFSGTYGLEVTSVGLVVFGSARDFDEAYVSATPVSSTATKGSGSGATFNITASAGAITAATVVAGGAGYAVGDTLTLVTSVGTEAILTVATLAVSAVATVTITNNGNSQTEPFLSSAVSGITYQQLQHPSLTNDSTETYNRLYHRLVKVVASTNYNGNAFAIAQFTDGRRFLYYNGSIVQHSANGIVMEGRLAKADLANDLFRQLQAIGWNGFANRTLGQPTSITRVGTTATLTYNDHGLSNGDTVEVSGATDASGVTPSRYNGIFIISNKTANTFDYTIRSDPGGSAVLTGLVTVLENGCVISKGPAANYYSATTSETSTSGQFGFNVFDQDGSGVSGFRAEACFQITANTGPFTITAPATANGTGTADLCDGSVTVASSATLTALKIRDIINSLSYVHGYTSEVNGINVYVYAPVAWGPVTFNLTVTGATTAACVTASNQLRADAIPFNLRSVIFVVAGTSASTIYASQNTNSPPPIPDGTLQIAATGGVQPYTYVFANNQSGGDFHITPIPNNVSGTLTATLDIRGMVINSRQTFTTNYQCTVKDSTGGTPLQTTRVFQIIFVIDIA